MRTKRIEVARSVATRLHAAEHALDVAATRIAELNAAMPMARIDANVSAMIGQAAFASSTDALALVARVREQLVATHLHLKTASNDMGLSEVSYGDSLKAPSGELAGTAQGHLRIAS